MSARSFPRPPRVAGAALRLIAASLGVLATLGLAACSSAPKKKKVTILMTEYHDARVGEEAALDVASEIGVFPDPVLNDYVNEIGQRLLRGVPRRGFNYTFAVVDQTEPNAFALPGGKIFLSRGLLALANNEDELACVIGHEIVHAVQRHAAAQQELARSGLTIGFYGAARMASYSREMEIAADRGGQQLCAAAGYNPMGLSTFLRSMDQSERLTSGNLRGPGWFDTHPGSSARSASAAARVGELRWTPGPELGDTTASLFERINGLVVGQNPEAGVFDGALFLHPDLDFQVNFPPGWRQSNSAGAVGAIEPRQEAFVFMKADLPPGKPQDVAQTWFEKNRRELGLEILESKPVKVGTIDAWRMKLAARSYSGRVVGMVTFFPFANATWSATGVTSSFGEATYLAQTLIVPRSFRPLTQEARASIRSTLLEIVTARRNEDLSALSERSQNAWDMPTMAVYNGVFIDHRFQGGEKVKIIKSRPYVSAKPAS